MSENYYNNIETEINNQISKRTYSMVVLKGIVVFPNQNIHFDVARDKSILAINKALETNQNIFLVAQKTTNSNVTPKDIYRVGVLAKVRQIIRLPEDIVRVVVTGVERKEIESYISLQPHFEVMLRDLQNPNDDEHTVEACRRYLKKVFDEYKKHDVNISTEALNSVYTDDAERFIYSLANIIFQKESDKQKILQEPSIIKAMEECQIRMEDEINIASLMRTVQTKVRKRVDKNHREYYLREQQKVISEELGENESDIEQYREKILSLKLSKENEERFLKEVNRLEKMSYQAPEASVIRGYLDIVIELPWHLSEKKSIDLVTARKYLDEDHFGLEKVKERIIEFLAVGMLTDTSRAPILCFVGPPGVGKTSIVSSIARASGRKLVTMSLGGVRDESEIRGHRRTYIGAMPGRIISGLKNIQVNNPVFLLDEIDKMSSDFRGDPSSALLEVLDPNINNNFKDTYLEVPFDLSKIVFVTTANTLDSIPLPLLDRLEIIELSGYTYEEKREIAKRYLIPKQLELNGLANCNIKFSDKAIDSLIEEYTRESGVRSLEREIGAVCRKIAVKLVESKEKKITVFVDNIAGYLGAKKFDNKLREKFDQVGIATGLAWTAVGGKTLNVEAIIVKGGKGDIKLTGSLGDVMKESCHTAITLVRSRANKYNIPMEWFLQNDFHIHFPDVATPKDGPSAGITIATAVLSAMTNIPVRADVAMTGEVTLSGKVLAIGGLKEKTLAALRNGIKKLVLANDNKKDLDKIPKSVQDSLEIIWADSIDTVFDAALFSKTTPIDSSIMLRQSQRKISK